MNCSRCSGFMIQDHFLDFEGPFGEMWATSWRCVNCGHVDDQVFTENRMAGSVKIKRTLDIEAHWQEDDIFLGAETYIGDKAA